MKGKKLPLLLRLRHWLIRKLGGYAEQQIHNNTVCTKIIRVQPERLTVYMTLDNNSQYRFGRDVSFGMVKREMARQIAEEIVKQGMILVDSTECRDIDAIKFRARLFVLPPDGAAWIE